MIKTKCLAGALVKYQQYPILCRTFRTTVSSSNRSWKGNKKLEEVRQSVSSVQPANRTILYASPREDSLLADTQKQIEPEKGRFGSLGEEISGKKLYKNEIMNLLNAFYQEKPLRELAKSQNIGESLFTRAFVSFKRYCYQSQSLPPELHVKFCDILSGHGHVTDLYPFFLSHAREAFPHLECHGELKKISDLGLPHNWYPLARSISRKVVYHAGPTNSGKTYNAMQSFLKAKSGIYCGPLKLLATEIYHKSNKSDVPCDLVTGEEKKFANPNGYTHSSHQSCTVEMTQLNEQVEVAVIDEIQMIRDPGRGWAWTRALLGVPANEVHLCGEESAIDVVQKILSSTADTFEVVRYERLTPLTIEDKALVDYKQIRPGDCIVCFSKDAIFSVSMELESLGHKVAVIYGTLPPGAKLAQCERFNQQKDCTVMVATDAIGMGLNLSIKRVIFHSLSKYSQDKEGNRTKGLLTTSQCLQIAGRAGRFKTLHEDGHVTTLKADDLKILQNILSQKVPQIERAGLHPTADQIELFGYHLPHLTLCNLIDLFVELCEYDSGAYFICDTENFKVLARSIDHVDLPLRVRYLFCCAPTDTSNFFVLAMFTKLARQFSCNEPITARWLCKTINWPLEEPKKLVDLQHLESVYDVFELYRWLSTRFPDMFPEPDQVTELQEKLDLVIYAGVRNIMKLLRKNKPDRGHSPNYVAKRPTNFGQ